MKLPNGKKTKILFAAMSVMFSLTCCFTGAFAWYRVSIQDSFKDNDIAIEYDPNLLDFTYSLYRYDRDLKEGVHFASDDDGFALSLSEYDTFITERNANNNNIIRFDITFRSAYTNDMIRNLEFSITSLTSVLNETFDNGLTTTDHYIRKHADYANYKYTSQKTEASSADTYVCNNISNVIDFKMFAYSYSVGETSTRLPNVPEINEEDDSDTYFAATEYFSTLDSRSFVFNGSKTNKIDLQTSDIPSEAEGVVVYLQYNYNDTLVNDFLTPNEFVNVSTSDVFVGSAVIDFLEDIDMLSIVSKGKTV